jgi:D-alanine transaminase
MPDIKPNFFMTITELGDNSNDKEDGIAVCSHPDLRWKRCDIKSLNLLPNVLAKMDAEKRGCKEAILVDDDGFVTEGAGSAFFMIKKNSTGSAELITRPLGKEILPSITRCVVEEIAAAAGLVVIEKTVTCEQVREADELFIAVTTQDVVPVVKFDDHLIGDGKPGDHTQALIAEFAKLVQTA